MILNNYTEKNFSGGGGIGLAESEAAIIHCTISGNNSSHGGGIFSCDNSLPTVTDSIVWANSGPEGPEVWVGEEFSGSSSLKIRFSDVRTVDGAVYVEPGSTLDWGPGNIEADPLFVGGGDYHLTSWSPCIDVGTDAGVYEDIDGDVRPIGAGFDMGADEVAGYVPIIIDLDLDYAEGILSLDYTIGTPVPALWLNYLVLTEPSVQVIPLWSLSLPAIDPPIEVPISFPFPTVGVIGIWTALFDDTGTQTIKLEWVDTGG